MLLRLGIGLILAVLIPLGPGWAQSGDGLVASIEKVKPSVVAIGSYFIKDTPKARFFGTGFAVRFGRHVVTNQHILEGMDKKKRLKYLRVFHPNLSSQGVRAQVVAKDEKHDLALLRLNKERLPSLNLGDSADVQEGEAIAFTGYPIGFVLGLNPTTHKGIVSAISPIILPSPTAKALEGKHLDYLRDPYEIFQLNAKAFPGNSGSPLYRIQSGEVVGVVNMVFVRDKKENLLKEPTGITYAIPIDHLKSLLARTFR